MNDFISVDNRPAFRRNRPVMVYRVYYDTDTGRCTHKTCDTAEGKLPFIQVDPKTYNEVDICDKFKVANGKLERMHTPVQHKRLSLVTRGRFRTVKNNMLFVVADTFVGDTDSWDYYKDDQ